MRSERLEAAISGRAAPLAIAAVALVFDTAKRRFDYGLAVAGLLDEIAHLATAALALLVLACFLDLPRRFYVAALVASVAIDLDHVPQYLRLWGETGHRPVTHSLATVLVVVGAAAVSTRHRTVLAGVATGLVLHLVRDIAEGPPGVRMLWPLQQAEWTAGRWMSVGLIVGLALARVLLLTLHVPRSRVRLFAEADDETASPVGRR